jgi:hypothetical protein
MAGGGNKARNIRRGMMLYSADRISPKPIYTLFIHNGYQRIKLVTVIGPIKFFIAKINLHTLFSMH